MRRGLRISSAAPPEFHPPRRPNFARRRRLCCALGPRGFRRRKNQGEGDGGRVGCGVGWGGAGQQPSPPSGPPWRRGGGRGAGWAPRRVGAALARAGAAWRAAARAPRAAARLLIHLNPYHSRMSIHPAKFQYIQYILYYSVNTADSTSCSISIHVSTSPSTSLDTSWRDSIHASTSFNTSSGILTTWTRLGKTVHTCLNMLQTCMYMF